MSAATVKNYELTFILAETSTPELATAKAAELKKSITEMGGEVSKEEHWGRRDLAYPIKRSRSGLYTTMWFSLPTTQVNPLEKALRFDESIIRSLVTIAYTSAQPGSLYPVVEEEKKATRRPEREEAAGSAEEQLRRSGSRSTKREEIIEEEIEELSEEDRLAQLETQLDSLLKDESSK